MASITYSIHSGQLVIRELPDGKVVWRGGYEAPAIQIVPLPKLDGCLVLLDPAATKHPTFENLFMVGSDGAVRWKARLPRSHDTFVNVIERETGVEAQTWNGQLVEIDLSTGHVRNARFVK